MEELRSKEQVLMSQLAQMEARLRTAENDRHLLQKQIARAGATPGGAKTNHSVASDLISPYSQEAMAVLNEEISILHSTIRHLRSANHEKSLSTADAFLLTPLIPKAPSQTQSIAHEAKDVLSSLVDLVIRPETRLIRLQQRSREERLSWRPAKESPAWQVGKQKEQWETWREWMTEVAHRANGLAMDNNRANRAKMTIETRKAIATVGYRLPEAEWQKSRIEVRIASPTEWDDVQKALGLDLISKG